MVAQTVKHLSMMQETWISSLSWEDLLEEGMATCSSMAWKPIPVWHGNPLQYSCLENCNGQKSLLGYSPWGCKESDMTERLSTWNQEKW